MTALLPAGDLRSSAAFLVGGQPDGSWGSQISETLSVVYSQGCNTKVPDIGPGSPSTGPIRGKPDTPTDNSIISAVEPTMSPISASYVTVPSPSASDVSSSANGDAIVDANDNVIEVGSDATKESVGAWMMAIAFLALL